MRPIAALALRPYPSPNAARFSDAVVVSPGRGRMQHGLPGYDLRVGPGVGRPHAARRLRGEAAEQLGVGVVAAGDCRRPAGVMMRHRGMSGARGQTSMLSLPPATRPAVAR
jgi:hypothetical protein